MVLSGRLMPGSSKSTKACANWASTDTITLPRFAIKTSTAFRIIGRREKTRLGFVGKNPNRPVISGLATNGCLQTARSPAAPNIQNQHHHQRNQNHNCKNCPDN